MSWCGCPRCGLVFELDEQTEREDPATLPPPPSSQDVRSSIPPLETPPVDELGEPELPEEPPEEPEP